MDAKTVQIMVFVYQALEEGWVVSKVEDGRYELSKPLQNITQQVLADQFPKDFLQRCTDLNHLLASMTNSQNATGIRARRSSSE